MATESKHGNTTAVADDKPAFKLVSGSDPADLGSQVNQQLMLGYQLLGHTFITGHANYPQYLQAVVQPQGDKIELRRSLLAVEPKLFSVAKVTAEASFNVTKRQVDGVRIEVQFDKDSSSYVRELCKKLIKAGVVGVDQEVHIVKINYSLLSTQMIGALVKCCDPDDEWLQKNLALFLATCA